MKNISSEETQSYKILLLGLLYDKHSSFLFGSSEAPPLVREALYSDSTNLWSEMGVDLGENKTFFDVGNIECNEHGDIEKAVSTLLKHNLPIIFIGGDHAITYPIIKSFAKKYGNLSILQFDAHPDLYDEFQGNRHSHACSFARIMEGKLVKRLVQVGIRGMNGHQREQAEKFGVEVMEMKDWHNNILLEFDSPLYISFDMDALDPAFAPGVSHQEPGGFSTREVIRIIQNIKVPIVGADIVEFNPKRDSQGITAMATAKILKEIAGKILTA